MPNPPSRMTKLNDKTQVGYNFEKSRWEGEEYFPSAVAASLFLKQSFANAGVHEGKDWDWRGGKRVDYNYFKVWVGHPTDKDLYAWWTPTKETWHDAFDSERATWFEFQEVAEKKQ